MERISSNNYIHYGNNKLNTFKFIKPQKNHNYNTTTFT